jgi:dihydrofolate synthase/folylpolyglutamate synthase
MLRDKDYPQIILNAYGIAEHIITVTPPGPRGLRSYELALEASKHHSSVTCADSLFEACELAALLAGKDGVIVAFGSLAFLSDIIKIVRKVKD